MNTKSPFRILSLDGGGIRGVVSATILKQVETQIKEIEGKSLTEYFDLVAGTSTGAILAAGIALGKEAEDLIKLYNQDGEKIFNGVRRSLRKWIPGGGGYLIPFTRYKNEGLINVLKENLRFPNGGKSEPTLLDVEKAKESPSLLILAYDALHGYTEYFASNGTYKEDCQPMWYTDLPLWQICVCSAAAPTYFPPYEICESTDSGKEMHNYIDGGVAANNPDLAAITHATYTKMRVNSQPKSSEVDTGLNSSDISVLSIGTGKIKHSFDWKKINKWGLLQWAQKIPDIFMAAPADFEEKVTRQLMLKSGLNQNRYLRINVPIDESLSAIDDSTIIKKLTDACEAELEKETEHYNFKTGNREKMLVEELIKEFIDANKRESDQDFKNRFEK